MNGSFIVLAYYTHQAAYAKDCINKDKPMMHCKGQCQMMKKLKAEESKDQENPERKAAAKNEVTLSVQSYFAAATLPGPELPADTEIALYSTGNCVDRSFAIFHPPQAL